MRESALPYEVAAAADVAPYAAQLAQTLVHIGARRPESGDSLDGTDFYRVPFEQARTHAPFVTALLRDPYLGLHVNCTVR